MSVRVPTVDVFCEVANESQTPVGIELWSSFALGGITPLASIEDTREQAFWGGAGRPGTQILVSLVIIA